MKRFAMLAILAILVLGVATGARAATEVKMTGDAFVYGIFVNNQNFTGWNTPNWGTRGGTQTEDSFQIWERFRLRADFVASEAVKFRLGLKIQDTWGHGTFTAANPSAAIQVYQAFLQFKFPGCDVEVTAGLQDLSLPANAFFCDSVVFGGDRAAALVIKAPLVADTLSLVTGFSRMIDTNRTYDPTTTQRADELDLYFLALPITVNGFNATPWGAVAIAGRGADYYNNGSYGNDTYFAESLVSAGSAMTAIATGNTQNVFKNNQNAFWWAGSTFEVSALDPIKFYADVVYGAGAMNDRKSSKRSGWFIDFGAEYTGWDVLTPQVFAWWSTGEDKSNGNGSERMPSVMSNWGPGNSFLFDDSQELLKQGNMSVNPIGSYGIGASLNNITFVEKLSHRLTFIYLRGNNSPRAIRQMNYYVNGGNLNLGANPYFVMGRDLTYNEALLSANFDTTYQIYENLAAVLETGWAHGYFQESVWGHRFTHQASSAAGNSWKVAFGFTYKF
jgi:hypothetical protein